MYFSVLRGVGYTKVQIYGNAFKHIQLHRLRQAWLKGICRSVFESPRFGRLPKPLQKRTVWWSCPQLFRVWWGGVHNGSNARKCRYKHIQLHKLEKVSLKALWDSIQPDVPKKSKFLGLDAFPNYCKNEWFGGRFGNFVFCGVGYTKV